MISNRWQEDTLAELAKKGAAGFALSSLIGKGGSKFGGLDIKRVYFGYVLVQSATHIIELTSTHFSLVVTGSETTVKQSTSAR